MIWDVYFLFAYLLSLLQNRIRQLIVTGVFVSSVIIFLCLTHHWDKLQKYCKLFFVLSMQP